VASSVFQLWIVGAAFQTLLALHVAPYDVALAETTHHYQALLGYFLYDTVYLVTRGSMLFILHHLGCLYVCWYYLEYGFPSLWFCLMMPVLGEVTNPFLSLRRILRETHGKSSGVYKINSCLLLTLYFECRMLGFPIVLLMHYPEVASRPVQTWLPIYVIMGGIYLVSIDWFGRLVKSDTGRPVSSFSLKPVELEMSGEPDTVELAGPDDYHLRLPPGSLESPDTRLST
jgi:hypothetical protein